MMLMILNSHLAFMFNLNMCNMKKLVLFICLLVIVVSAHAQCEK